MKMLDLPDNKEALVVVAHPDDETIWMGGTIKRCKKLNWTIFVLCRESDADRMPKFLKVANYYKAKGIICDLEDEEIMSVEQSVPKIKEIIRGRLPENKFDYIFTHGLSGDYGHPRHVGVHRAVKEMIENNELSAENIFYFAYERKSYPWKAISDPEAKIYVELSKSEWKAKRDVIKKLYGFSKMSFENRSCSRTETFNI